MKRSRIFVLALVVFAVLFVSASMGHKDMMKDGTFHHGTCDDKVHLPSGRWEKKASSPRKMVVTDIGITVAEAPGAE